MSGEKLHYESAAPFHSSILSPRTSHIHVTGAIRPQNYNNLTNPQRTNRFIHLQKTHTESLNRHKSLIFNHTRHQLLTIGRPLPRATDIAARRRGRHCGITSAPKISAREPCVPIRRNTALYTAPRPEWRRSTPVYRRACSRLREKGQRRRRPPPTLCRPWPEP